MPQRPFDTLDVAAYGLPEDVTGTKIPDGGPPEISPVSTKKNKNRFVTFKCVLIEITKAN